jgi:hypothetical protein
MTPQARLLALLGLTLLAACAGISQREGEPSARERYLHYAGAPISSFSSIGGIDGWRSLSRTELVVWTGMNDAYLLTVVPTCQDLEFATTIALVSRVDGTVSSGFDHVRAGRDRCQITEIRPIDYRLMKQEERELRKQST